MKLFIKTIGINRAKGKIGIATIAYDMLRYIYQERRRATA
ncbi:transposase IS4 family domain protein [Ochrobactrum quorumnocens]|uniref:Transposase IS4 family domain protein n=1 Tax=Ochrobactrum quorumnocens TaxID=271865 RepID=A0A248UBI0_9HYPH|nr:transposase IS4 family domain protein [[Ochrobactrum] quorumnocens]